VDSLLIFYNLLFVLIRLLFLLTDIAYLVFSFMYFVYSEPYKEFLSVLFLNLTICCGYSVLACILFYKHLYIVITAYEKIYYFEYVGILIDFASII
jgi:hypothetical protein